MMIRRFIYTYMRALFFISLKRRCHSPCCYYSRYKDIVVERCSYVRTFLFGSACLHFWLRVTERNVYVQYFCTSFSSDQNLTNFVK